MSFLEIFWLFFMLSALQPVLRQRMLEAMRMRKTASLERKRNSRVILLVHRQDNVASGVSHHALHRRKRL